MTGLSGRLPDFPWDTIAGARDRARAHPDGICDLSVGTPVDRGNYVEVTVRSLTPMKNGVHGFLQLQLRK